MLLPVDLMTFVSAGSPLANLRDAGGTDAGASASWLPATDASVLSEVDNGMINKIFMSYASDGEADPAARFAHDLKALLSANGVSFTTDQALLPSSDGMPAWRQIGEPGKLAWSVDELLQMAVNPSPGGNNLPLNDQTLPSELSNWLAALIAPAAGDDPAVESMPATAGAVAALSQAQSALSANAPASKAELQSISGNAMMLGGSAQLQLATAETQAAGPADRAASMLMSAQGQIALPETSLQPPLPADATRQASDTTQINPGSQKIAADAANASAFRSAQVNQSPTGDTNGYADDMPDLIRSSRLTERSQTIAGQLTGALSAAINAEPPASSASSQALTQADPGILLNRPEPRMFSPDSAQQAQSQAAQQSVARTADGVPRFVMDTAFGQQGWSDSLSRQLLVMSSQGVSSAQIQLDPPELGSLMVKIQVSADQQTNVSFVSQHTVVREALEQQLNRLQDLFRDQGLNLQDVSVSDQSPQQREGESGGQQGQGRDAGSTEQDPADAEPVMMRSESLIDFYA